MSVTFFGAQTDFLDDVSAPSSFRNLMTNGQTKYWCWTLNNYTEQEVADIAGAVEANAAAYICYGEEVGSGGTPHLQGYLELSKRSRLSGAKKVPGLSRAHFEARRGTQEQAVKYCQKDGTFTEFGSLFQTSQGKRTDLEDAVAAIKDGATSADLWATHTVAMVKYGKGLREAIVALQPKRQRVVYELESFSFHPLEFADGFSYIVYGESGVGKTSYMRSRFPTALMVSHMDDLTRFEPSVHEAIVFDDMSFTHLPRTAQIHLVDFDDDRSIHVRYQTAFIPAGTRKFFTSNFVDIFDLSDPAIARRVKTVNVSQ